MTIGDLASPVVGTMPDPGGPQAKPILFLGPDAGLFEQLAAYLAADGIEATAFETIADLAARLRSVPDAVLVLDTSASLKRRGLAQLVDYLKAQTRGVAPVFVCVAAQGGIEQRLDAVRSGAAAFFPKPVLPDELAERLAELIGGAAAMPTRVLVVEDQPDEAAVTTRVLEESGVEVCHLGTPLDLIEAAQAFHPDLILMDVELPGVGGLELTRVLREHDGLLATPVVLLGRMEGDGENDRSLALRAGADDFLIKPPPPARLLEVVECRVRRVAALRRKLAEATESGGPTGLCSRRRLLRHIDRMLHDPGLHGAGQGVLSIEIDAPDRLLCALGPGGSELLSVHVANLLRCRLGPADLAARVGDYRFAVVAERRDDAALEGLADTLRRAVSERVIEASGSQHLATVSIGVAGLRPPPDDAYTLIARAAKACAKAMADGGNRVEVHGPGAERNDGERPADDIQALIERALRTTGFQLLYQPMLAVSDQPGAQYDTLLRLRSADGASSLRPPEFLPVARRRGLMMKVDRWSMETALNTLKQQRDAGLEARLFVHQSMSTIREKSWMLWMRDQLLKRGLVDSSPVLQLGLADVLDNLSVANARLELLHRLGVPLCVAGFDDRPAGLTLLQTQPVSIVKLALELVRPENRTRLTEIIRRVHDLKRSVIAVGIEDLATIGRIMDCGADFIQGDFVQPPRDSLSFDFSDTHSE